jgi:hypothetical protein
MPMRATLGAQLNTRIDDLICEVGADVNPWERRFARKLAIAGASAILLSELGVAPWTEKRAIRAFRRLYRKARNAAATIDEIAERLTNRVRRLLSDGCFPQLRKGKKTFSAHTLERAKNGFLRELPEIGDALLMSSTQVEKLIARRGIFGQVIQRLGDQGIVRLGDDGKPRRNVQKRYAPDRPRHP